MISAANDPEASQSVFGVFSVIVKTDGSFATLVMMFTNNQDIYLIKLLVQYGQIEGSSN